MPRKIPKEELSRDSWQREWAELGDHIFYGDKREDDINYCRNLEKKVKEVEEAKKLQGNKLVELPRAVISEVAQVA